MFGAMLAATAIANAALEAKAIGVSMNTPCTRSNCFLDDPVKPCFPEEEKKSEPKTQEASKSVFMSPYERDRKYREYLKNQQMKSKMEEPKNPLLEWIDANAETILEILTNPGTHFIKEDELANVDKEELADFLFGREQIESVDIVNGGIEIVSR